MIDFQTRRGGIDPARAIDAFIDRHGAWRVLRAALWAVLARRGRQSTGDLGALDNRMRRDIGLPPARPDPRDPLAPFGEADRFAPLRRRNMVRGLD